MPVIGKDCSSADAIRTMETAGEKSEFCRYRLSNTELMTFREAHHCYRDERTGVSQTGSRDV